MIYIDSFTSMNLKLEAAMDYRFLGKTGMKVSELCLGAMTFGRETSEEDSYRMMDCFVDAGGNFIDTANVYSLRDFRGNHR